MTVILDDHLLRDLLAGSDAALIAAIADDEVATTNLVRPVVQDRRSGGRWGASAGLGDRTTPCAHRRARGLASSHRHRFDAPACLEDGRTGGGSPRLVRTGRRSRRCGDRAEGTRAGVGTGRRPGRATVLRRAPDWLRDPSPLKGKSELRELRGFAAARAAVRAAAWAAGAGPAAGEVIIDMDTTLIRTHHRTLTVTTNAAIHPGLRTIVAR